MLFRHAVTYAQRSNLFSVLGAYTVNNGKAQWGRKREARVMVQQQELYCGYYFTNAGKGTQNIKQFCVSQPFMQLGSKNKKLLCTEEKEEPRRKP